MPSSNSYNLTHPADILRHKQFNFLVTALEKNGHRKMNKEMSEKTEYGKGNISSFLKGSKPISDSFWEAFLRVFKEELAPIQQREDYQAIKVDDSTIQEPLPDEDILEDIEQRLAAQERNIHILAEQHKKDMELIKDQLTELTKSVNLLTLPPENDEKKAKKPPKTRPSKQKDTQ